MGSKAHLCVSAVKSTIRIAVCVLVFLMTHHAAIKLLAAGLAMAEVIGIVEELVDTRG